MRTWADILPVRRAAGNLAECDGKRRTMSRAMGPGLHCRLVAAHKDWLLTE
jgi:hypothetical protein